MVEHTAHNGSVVGSIPSRPIIFIGTNFILIILVILYKSHRILKYKNKMPQLDPINFFPQVLWLFILFLLLYTLIIRDFSRDIFKQVALRQQLPLLNSFKLASLEYKTVTALYSNWTSIKKVLK